MKTNLRSVLKFSLLLALVFALGLSACSTNNTANTAPPEVVETEEVVEDSSDVEPVVRGQELYSGLCIACHGPTAEGVTGLGKNLHVSEFFADSNDEELVAFISEGRPASDPANTTGVDMPPRGGNPNLTDDDLAAIVTYLRTLTQ
jgi:mono/diheme cytochrome c family protein